MTDQTLLKQLDSYVLYFEDFSSGDSFMTSGRTVTEADVVNFAALSADYNSLHVDSEFAATTPHGQRIAHGLLVLSIASGLCTRLPMMKFLETSILGLLNLECKFRRPCHIGDTLRVRLDIDGLEDSRKTDRGVVVMKRTAINQRDEEVMESTWRLVIRRRNAAEEAA